jgi:hypothetical protein
MFVAELHNKYKDSATSILPTPIPTLLIIFGLFMAGFPQDSPEKATWSNVMSAIMRSMTGKDTDIRRYWDSIGASTVLTGIFFSKNARRVLTSPVFNFLGRVSFPVYLLHNTLIKSVLTWMIYLPSAMNPPKNDKGEPMDLQRGTTLHMIVAIGVFYYILYRAASLWVQYIDPICANITNAFVRWATGARDGSLASNGRINGTLDKPVLMT